MGYEGKFNGIPKAVVARLEGAALALGLRRVTLGTFAEGTPPDDATNSAIPSEAFVTIPSERPIAFEKGPDDRRARAIWVVPVVVSVERHYADLSPAAGEKPLTDAILWAEKLLDRLAPLTPANNDHLPAGARAVRLEDLTVSDDVPGVPGLIVVEARFVYEVVVT